MSAESRVFLLGGYSVRCPVVLFDALSNHVRQLLRLVYDPGVLQHIAGMDACDCTSVPSRSNTMASIIMRSASSELSAGFLDQI